MNFKPFMMNFTRIKPPKFRVGRYLLNEYELRTLTLEVAQGKKPAGIKVTDYLGNKAVIKENGCLSASLEGLSLATLISLEIIRLNNKREE